MFATCTEISNSTNIASVEVTFIDLDFTGIKRTFNFTELCDSLSNRVDNTVDFRLTKANQIGDYRGFDIKIIE
ncbi:hypothetical protein ACFL6P_04015 [Candidatus Latescibacterota bacterium]